MPYLQNMCPKELKSAIQSGTPLLIGVGTIEYHGSQLPLGTDLMFVEGTLRELEKKLPVVIAPSFVYSPNGYAVSGPENGTVDISVDCFIRYCAEILHAYRQMGFKKIKVFVHHQASNIRKFIEVAIMKTGMYALQNELGNGWWTEDKSTAYPAEIEVCDTVIGTKEILAAFGGHGGKGETQAIMATYPETVKMNELTDNEPSWNRTAAAADEKEAKRCFDILIQNHVEKLGK
ncbi:MAG: creatininase family protein [Clostridia bacterium]|nr:creatininase family protein [Clostridia bacterium]MBQ7289248.1 creatininase family protein [Clostridia bacterium]